METPFEIEIEIQLADAELRVTARGSRGERPPPQSLGHEVSIDRLEAFTKDVGRAVRRNKALDPDVIAEAQALYAALISGHLQNLVVRFSEAAKGMSILTRLLLRNTSLQAISWEALCEPGTSEGFWGTSPRMVVARGITSADPWEPREVLGAVRILAIAPADDGALGTLRDALAEPIATGEIEWLEPIIGPQATKRLFFDSLRRSKSPHIIHFVGHGGIDAGGHPSLRLADDEDGEEVWIKVEALGRELAASFGEDLRLVVLEACEGAQPGALGSAAELLVKAGADAVVAHLWPVKADVARACSKTFYRTLTNGSSADGDVGASLAAARRGMLLESAEGFSPVLYLRGSGTSIFSFDERKVKSPKAERDGSGQAKNIAPALLGLLEKPFSMVIGDGSEADKAHIRAKLQQFLTENGDIDIESMSLSTLAQRCDLRFGPEKLSELFQDALWDSLDRPIPPLFTALTRQLRPGVHVTLLWFPFFERALAQAHPGRTIYVIQPPLRDHTGKPRVVKRAAGASGWSKEAGLPKRFEFDDEFVVLRLYGGYLPESRPIFTSAMLTEDDHIHGLIGVAGFRPPGWADEIMGRLRLRPALFLGLSVLEWRHRMLLRWLYDQRPAPKDSLALLDAKVARNELEIWESGGGLPGTGRIAALHEDLDDLAGILDTLPSPESPR